MKEIFGNEYYDYNIVMSLPNGRPMEGQVISRLFKRLIRKNNLPDVVFHSLRHSSTTYKLKLNGGDMKSVQTVLHFNKSLDHLGSFCIR